VTDDMVNLLTSHYRFLSEASAREVIGEMRDLTSLKVLACGYRGAGGAEGPTAQSYSVSVSALPLE
jgi:hypothetical protein